MEPTSKAAAAEPIADLEPNEIRDADAKEVKGGAPDVVPPPRTTVPKPIINPRSIIPCV